jgi:hypothetical protein
MFCRSCLLDWTFSLSSGHSQDKVRLGYSGLGSGEEIHHLAKDLGLFRKHNVEGETIRITGVPPSFNPSFRESCISAAFQPMRLSALIYGFS